MEGLLCDYGVDKEKVVKVLNPLRMDAFKPCYEGEDYYVYLGRLSEEKGIFTLIYAAREVKKSMLMIIGTGNLEGRLKNYVASNGIKNVEL